MPRRVLVPLDRTDRAEEALKALPQICDKGDEIILLSIAEPVSQTVKGHRPGKVVAAANVAGPGGGVPGVTWPDLPDYVETMDQTIARQLDELEGYLSPKAHALEQQGFKVDMAFEINDDAAEAIVDVAKRCKPTFIAMVRTTHPGIGERVFGTVAQHVIREDIAPVMILPSHS